MNNEEPTTPVRIEPVPYVWVEGNEKQAALLKQVADFCGYDLKHENPETHEIEGEVEPADIWPKVWQAIRYISNITCWTDSELETFLLSARKQVFHAETKCGCSWNCCKCDEDAIVIPLDYAPYPENPFVGGKISAMVNGRVVSEDITAEYLNEHLDPITGKVYIMRDDFPTILLDYGKCCCLCKRKVAILLEYNAGYEAIPDGILPLICPIVSKIEEAKIGMSNCHQAMTQVVGLLKRKKVGNVEYEWSNTNSDSTKTKTLYTDIYNIASLDEVMALSRCAMVDAISEEEIGDVV